MSIARTILRTNFRLFKHMRREVESKCICNWTRSNLPWISGLRVGLRLCDLIQPPEEEWWGYSSVVIRERGRAARYLCVTRRRFIQTKFSIYI